MCQVLNADVEIVRFRNGHNAASKCVRLQVTRILESNTKKHVRGTTNTLTLEIRVLFAWTGTQS